MTYVRRFLLVPLMALASHHSIAKESGWTGWLGPERDGRAQGVANIEEWPEALKQGWRVEVGEGYATPLMVGDRVFQHARQDGKEVLWCLARDTGNTIWKQSVPIEFIAGRGGERHGLGPKSTPTYADGRIFTLSITGLLTAWEAEDGKLLWKRDFRERFEVAHPYWGTATSPIVDDGRLFAHTGSCEEGALFCIDPKTGKDLWVRDEDANCYSSPRIETIAGVRQLVELNHTGLCGIDLKNGRLLWKHHFPHRGNNQNTPTPVRHEDTFIVTGENRGIFAVRVRKTDDKWGVEEIWRHREVSSDMSSPILQGGLVYGFSHFKSGQLFCLDPNSGEVRWKGAPRAGENAQFLALSNHVLALTDDGLCRILSGTGTNYEVVKTYRVAEDQTWTAPALVQDVLLTKDIKHLTLWRLSKSAE